MTKDHFERVLSTLLVAAALVMATALVRREFFPVRDTTAVAAVPMTPVWVPTWRNTFPAANRIGPVDAPVTIVVFDDLECPYCRMFHRTVRAAMEEAPTGYSLRIIHTPIPSHRFALPAARAAECALGQGRLAEFLDVVFDKQDSLGLKSWSSYAVDAGVSDSSAIGECAKGDKSYPRIEAGLKMAEAFAVRGTPTIIVNGWRYPTSPTKSELQRVLTLAKQGRPAFDSKGKKTTL